jgi:hypothetical protein
MLGIRLCHSCYMSPPVSTLSERHSHTPPLKEERAIADSPPGRVSPTQARTSRSDKSRAASVSLLSARVTGAARKVLAGQPLQAGERSALRDLSSNLRDEAEAVRFFQSGGREGRAPRRRATAGVGVAALTDSAPTDENDLPQFFESLADALDAVAESKRDASSLVAEIFSEVSSLARSHAGSSGERVLRNT